MQTLRQINKVDFTGQNFYCGIDIHKKNWTVTIHTDDIRLKTFTQDPDPNMLVKYLHKNYPGGNYIAAYEAGYFGFNAQRKLAKLGVNCMVINAADIPTTNKEKDQKRDPVDSKKIAHTLRAGLIKSIWVPPVHNVQDRQLMRTRRQMVKDKTRNQNRIKAFLQYHGIDLPDHFCKPQSHWSRAFISWLEKITMEEPTATEALQSLVRSLKNLREELKHLLKLIRNLSQQVRYQKLYNVLIAIPGIGMITAMTVLTEIGDISRFKTVDAFRSFIGLILRSHSSGEKDYNGKITMRKSENLRSLLIEAAWTSIRSDSTYLYIYSQYKKRMDANKAIVRTTRKMINHIYYSLKENQ